jgi:septum formation protein
MTDLKLPQGVQVILASKSPRRRELLGEMGIPFTTLTCEVPEDFPSMMHPRDAVRFLSEKKARAVAQVAPKGDAIIIASDTLVEVDGEPLGKPRDKEDAKRMLWKLSGRHHNVHTGVCVIRGEHMISKTDTTDVFFFPLDDHDIESYIATGEPMDKAGAYGIQGKGGRLVSHINGHLDTVIGLPCEMLEEMLQELTAQ